MGSRSPAPTSPPGDVRAAPDYSIQFSLTTETSVCKTGHPLVPTQQLHDPSQGQPLARAHCRISRCPIRAAPSHVRSSQGQPLACAHCRTSRCPPCAAPSHVASSQGHPLVRAHLTTSRWPPRAATAHVCSFQEHPCARAHFNTWRWPLLAA